jgi:glycerophosphoryl diester phosphodiesterase
MRRLFTLAAALACLAATGCAARPPALPDLGARLDCLRERNLALVAAHRGRPDPSAAENAMSSFTATLAAGVPFLEIDIATTSDGVLVLLHDDTLDRTTTGKGPVTERTWDEVRGLKLKRPDGTVLDEGLPLFADVLRWARQSGACFEVDVKKTTRWQAVIDAIRAAGMQQQVVIVTYNVADARTVHAIDPQLMISVTLAEGEGLETLRGAIPAERAIVWVGQQQPDPAVLAAFRRAGIEPILGTLGREGDRLDDRYVADGNPSEYADLARAGVVVIASDRAVAAQRAIGFGYRGCWPPGR